MNLSRRPANLRVLIIPLLLCASLLLSLYSSSPFAANYRLFVGEIKTLNLGDIQRVAVGNGGLISTSILDNGRLLILAEKEGDTELQIWLEDGRVIAHKFYIIAQNPQRNAAEIKAILGAQDGLEIVQVGKSVVLKGPVSQSTTDAIEKLKQIYDNILDLTKPTAGTGIKEAFSDIPGLAIKSAGDKLIVSGDVTTEQKEYIAAVKEAYPGLLDLTSAPDVDSQPMVHMHVQITEFSTNAMENLGIAWLTKGIQGPSLGYAHDFQTSSPGVSVVAQNNNPLALPNTLLSASSPEGFFGIATLISSTIDLAVSSGSALVLASPTLSARSGSKAEFLAGGEFPVSVPGGVNGNTIEFKEYGIKLNIEPTVGRNGAVVAKVEIEISDIDNNVKIDGVPGVLSRKTNTEVSLNEGETLAISGLVNRRIDASVSRVKWFSDIPVLGELFKSKAFTNNRSDLVIFITPQIYDAASEENTAAVNRASELSEQFFERVKNSSEILD